MNSAKRKKNDLLPFSVIASASNGNVDAINAVLKHFESYIITVSTRPFFDEYGNKYFCVDNDIRRRLESKLIKKIHKFKIA